MNKRAVMMMVVTLAVVALALPIASMRSRAANPPMPSKKVQPTTPAPVVEATPPALEVQQRSDDSATTARQRVNSDIIQAMGLAKRSKLTAAELSAKIAKGLQRGSQATAEPQSGTPLVMNTRSALSVAIGTTIGGRDN